MFFPATSPFFTMQASSNRTSWRTNSPTGKATGASSTHRRSRIFRRLHRDLRALAEDDEAAYLESLSSLGLRSELEQEFKQFRPAIEPWVQPISDAMRAIYDARMRVTGQNGLSDYDVGFTNFLYTFETSTSARQKPPEAGALR